MSRSAAAAILLAAGRSTRMQGREKTLAQLGGIPLAAHSLRTFAACAAIDTMVLVSSSANYAALAQIAAEHGAGKVCAVVLGGARRQDSVAAGLRMLPPCEFVAVHDIARPFVTSDLIERGLALAAEHGAAVVAAPVYDTVKEGKDGFVRQTLNREHLWSVQTPQTFRRILLERAHAAARDEVSDDAMLVEALGEAVALYKGSARNLKVTTLEDLAIAEALLKSGAAIPTATT